MTPNLAARFSLAGRTAIVTGASGALGARFAETLAGAGAAVALAARRTAPMEALRERLESQGARAAVVAMDVTDGASVEAAVAAAEAALGPVDLVLNNSGVAEPAASLDQSDEDWHRVFAVNLDGARRVSVAAVRRLVAAKRPGAIVNVASILGLRQGAGVTAYAASKAAMVQMTAQHALEWSRYGIRVNALAPGYIETDLNRDFFNHMTHEFRTPLTNIRLASGLLSKKDQELRSNPYLEIIRKESDHRVSEVQLRKL